MIRYYKLFDLLNRMGKKKSDLREILSSKTVAKLSKGENLNTDVIDKICLYLNCQPSDIMEVVTINNLIPEGTVTTKNYIALEGDEQTPDLFATEETVEINGAIHVNDDNPLH